MPVIKHLLPLPSTLMCILFLAGINLIHLDLAAQSPIVEKSRFTIEHEKQSINAALEYMDRKGLQMELQVYVVYQYLERKFSIKPISENEAYRSNLKVKTEEFLDTKPFLRLIDKKWGISKDSMQLNNNIDQMTSKALYCDYWELDSNYLNELAEMADRGRYSLPHAMLSMQWIEENNCISTLDSGYANLKDSIAQKLFEAIDAMDGLKDVEIECIAMLYYAGYRHLVKEQWIPILIWQQLEEGGWSEKPEFRDVIEHTTVLSLWVLLEHLYPNTDRTPWIRE